MNNAYIRRGLGLLAFSFCFALFSLIPVYYGNGDSMKGELLFPKAAAAPQDIARIIIHTPKDVITLEKDDNLWRVREADMYYANYQMVEKLLGFLLHSRIHRPVELDDAAFADNFVSNASEIVLENGQGKRIESIVVGRRTYNNKFAYVRFSGNERIFLASAAIQLPEYEYAWLQQPLLTLSPTAVRDIIIRRGETETVIGRDIPEYPFWIMEGSRMVRRVDVEDLLSWFKSVGFTNVRSAQNFDEQEFEQKKELKIITFDGLIIDVVVFKNGSEYWLKQKLSATSLPTSEVNAYIKNNGALSDYWYFLLSSYAGSRLWKMPLME